MSVLGEPVVDGFRVVTFDGAWLGVVAGMSEHSIVIERRRGPLRSWRAVPARLTFVKGDERTVVVLASAQAVTRSPKIEREQLVDDAAVAAYYERVTR
jgi:hypothetical protein